MENMRTANPEFRHSIFNEKDCRVFIQLYFDDKVLHAYDSLIPKAYKADLWRYCVLYIHGGIYVDAKMKMVNRFRLVKFIQQEYFVRDTICSRWGIFNGFIVTRPQNPILGKAIQKIIDNVQQKYYGKTCLSPTGPLMLRPFFTKKQFQQLPLELYVFDVNSKGNLRWGISKVPVSMTNMILLKSDDVYENQQENQIHYSKLWNTKQVYKTS
jgi:mannosyltransferase OCH1-like enzyme